MPPQNVNPAPNGQNNYDFFLNPPPPPKRPLFGASSLRQRLIVVVGGCVLLIILVVIVASLFKGGGHWSNFIVVAQDQHELARVGAEAEEQATVQTTKNLGQTIALSITSAQTQLLTYMQGNGQKLSTQQLSATKNVQTDKELSTAAAASNFDPVFCQVMQSGLQNYAQAIKTAYQSAGPNGKKLLQTEYNGAELLLKQTSTANSALGSQ